MLLFGFGQINRFRLRLKGRYEAYLGVVFAIFLIGSGGWNTAWADAGQGRTENFTGAGLHSGNNRIAIAYTRAEPGLSGISIRTSDMLHVVRDLPMPAGLRPFDPAFSPDGASLVFAGFCAPTGALCSQDMPGWNIFELSLDTGLPRRLTDLEANLVRVSPRYDNVTADVYFVGIASSGRADLDRLASPSAVFRMNATGGSDPVFPKGSYSEETGAVFHPIGTLNAVDLLAVAEGRLILKARFKVPSSRPTRAIENTPDADARLTGAADRMFYSKPRQDFRDRETANTLVFVDTDSVRFADEFEHVSTSLGPRLGLHIAAADATSETAFGVVQSLDPALRNAIAAIGSNAVHLVQKVPDLRSVPVDFEVSGPDAVLFVEGPEASVTAFVFSDWGPPRPVPLFTREQH